jgi:hypothetical protein
VKPGTLILGALVLFLDFPFGAEAKDPSKQVQEALKEAGENRGALETVLQKTDPARKAWAPLYPMDPGRFGKSPATEFVPLVATSSGFNPILVTGRYTQTGKVRLVLKEKGKLLSKFKGFSVSVVTDGAFKPLDDLGSLFEDGELQTDSTGSFSCELGKGRYLAVAGKRDPDGNPSFVMKGFIVVPGPTTEVELELAGKQ